MYRSPSLASDRALPADEVDKSQARLIIASHEWCGPTRAPGHPRIPLAPANERQEPRPVRLGPHLLHLPTNGPQSGDPACTRAAGSRRRYSGVGAPQVSLDRDPVFGARVPGARPAHAAALVGPRRRSWTSLPRRDGYGSNDGVRGSVPRSRHPGDRVVAGDTHQPRGAAAHGGDLSSHAIAYAMANGNARRTGRRSDYPSAAAGRSSQATRATRALGGTTRRSRAFTVRSSPGASVSCAPANRTALAAARIPLRIRLSCCLARFRARPVRRSPASD